MTDLELEIRRLRLLLRYGNENRDTRADDIWKIKTKVTALDQLTDEVLDYRSKKPS